MRRINKVAVQAVRDQCRPERSTRAPYIPEFKIGNSGASCGHFSQDSAPDYQSATITNPHVGCEGSIIVGSFLPGDWLYPLRARILLDMANNPGRKKSAPVTELVADFIGACRTSVRSERNTIEWNHLELEGAGRGVRLHDALPKLYTDNV